MRYSKEIHRYNQNRRFARTGRNLNSSRPSFAPPRLHKWREFSAIDFFSTLELRVFAPREICDLFFFFVGFLLAKTINITYIPIHEFIFQRSSERLLNFLNVFALTFLDDTRILD